VFKNAVTRASGKLIFGGDVYLANSVSTPPAVTYSLTFSNVDDLILNKGSTIYLGETPILTSAVGAILKPAVSTALITGIKPTSTTPNAAAIAASKTLTLTGVLDIIDGSLEVVGGEDDADKGIFALGNGTTTGSVKTEKSSKTNGTLSIAKGATVSLTYGTAASKITIGHTEIASPSGTKPATLTASGGAVTLGDNAIVGSGATLIAANNPVFTLDDNTNGGANLNITGVNLDLAAGNLVINGNTVAQTVSLVDQAKITLNKPETSAANARTKIGGGGTISENAERIGMSDGKNAKIVSLGHTTGGDVVITGIGAGGSNVTLNRSTAFVD
jgi:hypothetical protein